MRIIHRENLKPEQQKIVKQVKFHVTNKNVIFGDILLLDQEEISEYNPITCKYDTLSSIYFDLAEEYPADCIDVTDFQLAKKFGLQGIMTHFDDGGLLWEKETFVEVGGYATDTATICAIAYDPKIVDLGTHNWLGHVIENFTGTFYFFGTHDEKRYPSAYFALVPEDVSKPIILGGRNNLSEEMFDIIEHQDELLDLKKSRDIVNSVPSIGLVKTSTAYKPSIKYGFHIKSFLKNN
jgi:hypothetical protein